MKTFLSKHIGVIISTTVLFAGIVSSYAVLQYRVSQLEKRPVATVSAETIDSRIEFFLEKHKQLFEKDIQYLKEEQKAIQQQLQQVINLLLLQRPMSTSTSIKK